jgi:hypothetical protein
MGQLVTVTGLILWFKKEWLMYFPKQEEGDGSKTGCSMPGGR